MAKKTAKKTAKSSLNPVLIKRAKKIGLTKAQIATFSDSVAFKTYLDGISPQTNPDAKTKPGMSPKPIIHTEPMPAKFDFESKMEAKFISQNRTQFDENALQAKFREINRKYGPGGPIKVVKTVFYKPVKGMLTTKFEIFMR